MRLGPAPGEAFGEGGGMAEATADPSDDRSGAWQRETSTKVEGLGFRVEESLETP